MKKNRCLPCLVKPEYKCKICDRTLCGKHMNHFHTRVENKYAVAQEQFTRHKFLERYSSLIILDSGPEK